MENSKETRRKNPKMDDTPTDINTPIGAFQEALLVSSERWADASKPGRTVIRWSRNLGVETSNLPVIVYCDSNIPHTATYAGEALSPHPGSPVPSLKVPKTNLPDWWIGAFARIAMAKQLMPTECKMMDELFR